MKIRLSLATVVIAVSLVCPPDAARTEEPAVPARLTGTIPAGDWAIVVPPIGRDKRGREVVLISAPRQKWTVEAVGLDYLLRYPRPAGNACKAAALEKAMLFLNAGGGDRAARLMSAQYKYAECEVSDGGPLFHYSVKNPDADLVR